MVQLHGDEDDDYIDAFVGFAPIIKALPFDPERIERFRGDGRLHALLVDSGGGDGPCAGGSGEALDWEALAQLDRAGLPPLMLAGGLTPGNVGEAIRLVRPFAVDVSSGIEAERGVKDRDLMTAFCEAVRAADAAVCGR